MPAPFTTPVAKSTPFDNATNGFISTDVQAAIEEIQNNAQVSASPGFSWGKAGNANANTWLANEGVPSNITGRNIFLINPKLTAIYTACASAATYTLEIYQHDGITYTLLTTLSVTAQRTKAFIFDPPILLTTGKELAVKIGSGSAQNIVVGALLKGTLT